MRTAALALALVLAPAACRSPLREENARLRAELEESRHREQRLREELERRGAVEHERRRALLPSRKGRVVKIHYGDHGFRITISLGAEDGVERRDRAFYRHDEAAYAIAIDGVESGRSLALLDPMGWSPLPEAGDLVWIEPKASAARRSPSRVP